MTALSNSAVRALRPTLVVAEALVDRQDPVEILDRAKKLGFSPVLANAVVGVCCGQQHCDQPNLQNSMLSSVKSVQT